MTLQTGGIDPDNVVRNAVLASIQLGFTLNVRKVLVYRQRQTLMLAITAVRGAPISEAIDDRNYCYDIPKLLANTVMVVAHFFSLEAYHHSVGILQVLSEDEKMTDDFSDLELICFQRKRLL
ncbi:hypothetical protein SCP_0701150 [Sparassis crispa]|uniref:Uncharacterized protein n=1 Tax=Sparassis crispa TaxID=139825 RepID=A0A401GRV3_9APHY|nr:hypothetical protein SCP_0701150 [Sparassis crispa]GBE84933.1 hypothetical protein SCP_0701150 [Sparassis crispa]